MRAGESASGLAPELVDRATEVGMSFGGDDRAATVAIVDQSVVFTEIQRRLGDQIELLPTAEAVQHHHEVAAISWSLLDPGLDESVAEAVRAPTGGFFIRVRPGQKVAMPIQACLLLATTGSRQVLHNIVVVEDDAELSLITGCTAPIGVRRGDHIGATEVVLGAGATLTDTMIHRWSPEVQVRPRIAVRAEAGATYVSNYVLLEPPRSLQSETRVMLEGDKSRAEIRSILLGTGRASIDVDTELRLEGAGTNAESVSRVIARDRSNIVVRALLVGLHDRSQGRLDCRGLLQSAEARITAIPKLQADRAPRSQLAHEATIGPISEEAIEYIMTRGVRRDDAVAAITRGFLKAGLPRLPAALEQRIHELSLASAVGSL